MNTRSFILSAVIAGVITGLLGNLPLLNFVNCILCLWVWLGGFLAVYLYRRYQPAGPGLTNGQGAGLGALTGLVGALIGLLVYLVTGALSAPLMERIARNFQIDMPVGEGGFGQIVLQGLVFLVIDLILYPLFGALAGLIAANTLWKKPAQPVQ